MRSPRAWWLRVGPPALALVMTVSLAVGPAGAAYQASVYDNKTAFYACDGTYSTIPTKLRALAVSALQYLGYSPSGFEGTAFTKAKVLSRAAADRAFYVHSHGDHYYTGWGFRDDGGVCSGQIVTGGEIKKLRTSAANLVVASACHLGESASDFSYAFGIEHVKSLPSGVGYRGPEFFLGYVGTAWTIDMLAFETNFWARVKTNLELGTAFAQARALTAWRYPTVPDWYGSYTYSGRATTGTGCLTCM